MRKIWFTALFSLAMLAFSRLLRQGPLTFQTTPTCSIRVLAIECAGINKAQTSGKTYLELSRATPARLTSGRFLFGGFLEPLLSLFQCILHAGAGTAVNGPTPNAPVAGF